MRIWVYLIVLAIGIAAWSRVKDSSTARSAAAGVEAPQRRSPIVADQLAVALPTELFRVLLEPAIHDPFAAFLHESPVPTASVPTHQVMERSAAPSSPALGLVFSGRMTAPDGSQIIYVTHGLDTLQLAEGQVLPNGYRVRAITAHAVVFDYPPLSTTARLELPPAPLQEIR